jgi:hypothetical protein
MKKDPVFYNKNGDLSVYSFACGYIQEKSTPHGMVKLYKDGHWHLEIVKDCERMRWDCFDTLTEARRAFRLA